MQEAARIHAAAGATRISTGHVPPLVAHAPQGFDPEAIDALCAQIARRPAGPHRLGLWSAHQMGTCRMGREPGSSAFGPWGESHEIAGLWIADASAFPSASGVNPMITIMALAYRNAQAMLNSL